MKAIVNQDTCIGCGQCVPLCPRNALSLEKAEKGRHAVIDKERCINCGRCAEACPYSAILNRRRPCQNACKIGAISMKA